MGVGIRADLGVSEEENVRQEWEPDELAAGWTLMADDGDLVAASAVPWAWRRETATTKAQGWRRPP